MAGDRISLASNSLSLGVQRRLAQHTDLLERTFTRLASGSRINSASDDAAGLAVATALTSDIRVFSQGVRNLNDGISILNVAQGALDELSSILGRQSELATQAASGSYTAAQRAALETEANALVDEFNRIVESTTFNGRSVLASDQGILNLQSEYGENGIISLHLGQEFAGATGDGTFDPAVSNAAVTVQRWISAGDVNGDGILDAVGASEGDATILLGVGDGTFETATTLTFGSNVLYSDLADVNGDGNLDIVGADYDLGTLNVMIGNGDGTFSAYQSYAAGGVSETLQAEVADINGDGEMDVVVGNVPGDSVAVFIGNGDGSFKARQTFATHDAARDLQFNDFDGDGELDLIVTGNSGGVHFMQGNGNGTFKAGVSYRGGAGVISSATIGDFNGDGIDDLVVSDYDNGYGSLLIGNGNGTFQARTTISIGPTANVVRSVDLDSDGDLDLVTANDSPGGVSVTLGNGDGTFRARVSYAGVSFVNGAALGDFNGDGAIDIVTANNTSDTVGVLLANTQQISTIEHYSFATIGGARSAMRTIERAQDRVALELGVVGANQSRIGVAIENLGSRVVNLEAAKSRITDIDVAEETARLVRTQVLQQAATAILAQANQAPELMLQLLSQAQD